MNNVVLFDGECNFCDQSVQFIIKRDPQGHFRFASQQSDAGKKLLKQYEVNQYIDSLIVIKQGSVYTKSTAALHISKDLEGGWKFGYLFIAVPKPIRDFFYNVIAKNRYRWFGRKDECRIPTPEMRKRFL